MLELLHADQFDAIYRVMEESFPPEEFRPYGAQRALLDDGRYSIYGLRTAEGEVKAFLTLWRFDSFAYVEHFAVASRFRNGGLGADILREVTALLDGSLCLEVEPPEGEMPIRRIGFYERNGFCYNAYPYMQPPISPGNKAIPLRIMTYGAPVDGEAFREIRDTLYHEVYRCDPEAAAELIAQSV